MVWLLDTNVLLRYVLLRDPPCPIIRTAVARIKQNGDTTAYAAQTAAEFWNVCTRPASARGGYGFSSAQADARLRLIERAFTRLLETEATYLLWRQLITAHAVSGVQVHDARLVALMQANSVTHILTLNPADFQRYAGIAPVHPSAIP